MSTMRLQAVLSLAFLYAVWRLNIKAVRSLSTTLVQVVLSRLLWPSHPFMTCYSRLQDSSGGFVFQNSCNGPKKLSLRFWTLTETGTVGVFLLLAIYYWCGACGGSARSVWGTTRWGVKHNLGLLWSSKSYSCRGVPSTHMTYRASVWYSTQSWSVKCSYPGDHASSGDTDSALDLVFAESLGTVWLLRFVNVSTTSSYGYWTCLIGYTWEYWHHWQVLLQKDVMGYAFAGIWLQ